MDIEQLLLTRQSCRNYQEKPVDEETLRKIAELAHLAPSACNAQPWKIYAATGAKAKEVAHALQGMGMNKFTEKCPAFFAIAEGKTSFIGKVGARRISCLTTWAYSRRISSSRRSRWASARASSAGATKRRCNAF